MSQSNVPAIGGIQMMGGVNASNILEVMSNPIAIKNEQINVMLQQIASSPTPSQTDIVQLQMYVEQYNNYILLTSSTIKSQEDNQKQVINNISS